MKGLAKRSKSVKVFSRFFVNTMVFYAETSRICNSVTSNFCTFRPNRAIPRPWVARCIQEKFFVISIWTFVFVFCFFQKVCLRGKRDQNPNSVVLFRRIFNCPAKFVVSFIQRLIPPLFAVSDKHHEITQKYFLTESIFHETEFLAANVWFSGMWFAWLVLLICVIISTFLKTPPRCKSF